MTTFQNKLSVGQKWVLGLFLVLTSGLMGCQPRDVDPRYGTVEAGKVGSITTNFRDVKSPSQDFNFNVNYVEVKDEPGQQLSTCKSGSWNDIRMHDRSKKDIVYKSIYTGQRVAVIAAASNCHKVGMRVLLSSVTDGRGSNYGHAVITKLMLIERKDITEEMMAAMDVTAYTLDNSILRGANVASIAVFKYVQGSSPSEEKFLNSDVVVPNGVPEGQVGSLVSNWDILANSPSKDIEIINATESVDKIGQRLASCPKGGWDDLRIYDRNKQEETFRAVYSGQRVAFLGFAKSCHTAGMRVRLSSSTNGPESHFGEAIITGIYVVDKDTVVNHYLAEVAYDSVEDLERYLKTDTKASIVTFKYVKGSAAQENSIMGLPVDADASAVSDSGEPSATSDVVSGGGTTTAPTETGSRVNTGGAGDRVVPNTGGSASTTATFVQNIETLNSDVMVSEYSNRKALLSTCSFNRAWTDFRSFRKLDPQMISGERTMAINKGKSNCYQPTDVLNIHSPNGVPYEGQVRIKEVFVMKTSDLTDEIIKATAQSKEDILSFVGTEEWINVTVFEYVPYTAALQSEAIDEETGLEQAVVVEGLVASRPGHVLSACNAQVNPPLLVSTQEEQLFSGSPYRKAFAVASTPCWAVGTAVNLMNAETGALVLQDKVRLVRVELKAIVEITGEELGQLGYADATELKQDLSRKWGRALTDDQVITLLFIRN